MRPNVYDIEGGGVMIRQSNGFTRSPAERLDDDDAPAAGRVRVRPDEGAG